MGPRVEQRKLSPKDAAARFEAIFEGLRAQARTSPEAHGVEHYLFERLLTGIAEAIRSTGVARISLSYAEWALLANARGSGKQTSAKNVKRIFSKWAEDFDGFAPADGVAFAVHRPGKRGTRIEPGRAGGVVTFRTDEDREQLIRPPQHPSDIPLLREVRQLVEAARLREELAPSRLEYLNNIRLRINAKAAQAAARVLEKLERRLATEHARRVAAYFAAAVLTAVVLGGGVATAQYRAARERLIRTFEKFMISASGACTGPEATVAVSFAAQNTEPPYIVFRNDQAVGEITAASEQGTYYFLDRDVPLNRAYTYRVGKRVWGIGQPVMTTPVATHTPNCRPAGNLSPDVSEMTASLNPAVIREPVRFSVSATDYGRERLRYYWSIPSLGVWRWGSASETFTFDRPGYHDVMVKVDDGFEPAVIRNLYLGVAEPIAGNKPAVLRRLFVGPRHVRPDETVRLAAAAHDPEGSSMQYAWSFETGATKSLSDAYTTTSYTTAGTYRAQVRVIDSNLAETEGVGQITVSQSAPIGPRCKWISAVPSLWPPTAIPAELTIVLADGSPKPTQVIWDFGDGTEPSSGNLTVKHRYARAGTYSVVADVANDANNDVCTVQLNVGLPMPENKPSRHSGMTEPMSGTPATTFVITAQPPEESKLTGRIVAYRFTFFELFSKVQLRSEWQSSPVYRMKFQPGSWSVTYEVRYEGDRGTGVYSIGDIPVSKQ